MATTMQDNSFLAARRGAEKVVVNCILKTTEKGLLQRKQR
jgi:hypothetical protein